MSPLERSIIEAALLGCHIRRAAIDEKIAIIQDELRARGLNPDGGMSAPRKRTLSQETRAKMARAQRKRHRKERQRRAAAGAEA